VWTASAQSDRGSRLDNAKAQRVAAALAVLSEAGLVREEPAPAISGSGSGTWKSLLPLADAASSDSAKQALPIDLLSRASRANQLCHTFTRAIRVAGRFYDKDLMVLTLK
jgi:hypothetical protein